MKLLYRSISETFGPLNWNGTLSEFCAPILSSRPHKKYLERVGILPMCTKTHEFRSETPNKKGVCVVGTVQYFGEKPIRIYLHQIELNRAPLRRQGFVSSDARRGKQGSAEIRFWRHFRLAGQRLSPWPCKLSDGRGNISPRVQAPFFLCTTYVMPNALNLSVSINAKNCVSWLSFDVYERENELSKLSLNSSFCAVTADSKSRWAQGRKAYFRGVIKQHVRTDQQWARTL